MLADAAYSRCFLTFLGNCTKDRIELLGALGQGPSFFPCTGARGQRPISVWTFIEALLQVRNADVEVVRSKNHVVVESLRVMYFPEVPLSRHSNQRCSSLCCV